MAWHLLVSLAGGLMKLTIYSSFTIAAALLFSAGGIGCSKKDSNTAADRPDTLPSTYADRAGKGNLTGSDRDFAVNAAQGGMAEEEMGRLAQQQGSTQGLKDYGRQLVDDHTKINNDLKDLSLRERFTLPTTISSKQRDTLDK